MATHEDKERNASRSTPASTPDNTKPAERKPVEKKDPDLYDPVGMAGQKAGIVKEIEEELDEEARDPRPDREKENIPRPKDTPR